MSHLFLNNNNILLSEGSWDSSTSSTVVRRGKGYIRFQGRMVTDGFSGSIEGITRGMEVRTGGGHVKGVLHRSH